ncbi:hypothetical protein HPG69_005782 [Diceros bicornis minor]|uniref:Uncharacterized protein n=1 Tax=Diceros bicornis minor TaxID=77932 RepID=A0A7J7ET23_DICBM|nr:hypothetical protein HPG69_005782 [Diceros bicornis minor]
MEKNSIYSVRKMRSLCRLSVLSLEQQIFCMQVVVKEIQNHIQAERQRILKVFNETRGILDSLEQR